MAFASAACGSVLGLLWTVPNPLCQEDDGISVLLALFINENAHHHTYL